MNDKVLGAGLAAIDDAKGDVNKVNGFLKTPAGVAFIERFKTSCVQITKSQIDALKFSIAAGALAACGMITPAQAAEPSTNNTPSITQDVTATKEYSVVSRIVSAVPKTEDNNRFLDAIQYNIFKIEFKPKDSGKVARMEAAFNGLSDSGKGYENTSLQDLIGTTEFSEANFDSIIDRVYKDASAMLPNWGKMPNGDKITDVEVDRRRKSSYDRGPTAFKKRFHEEWTDAQRTKFLATLNSEMVNLKTYSSLNPETIRLSMLYVGAIVTVGDDPKKYDVSDPMNVRASLNLRNLNDNAVNFLLLHRDIAKDEIPTVLFKMPNGTDVKVPLISKTLLEKNQVLFGSMDLVPGTITWLQRSAWADIIVADAKQKAADVKREAADVKREAANVKREAADVKREAADVKREAASLTRANNLNIINTSLAKTVGEFLIAKPEEKESIQKRIMELSESYRTQLEQVKQELKNLNDPTETKESIQAINNSIVLFNKIIARYDASAQIELLS